MLFENKVQFYLEKSVCQKKMIIVIRSACNMNLQVGKKSS